MNVGGGVGAEGLMAGAGLLSRPADEFGNDPSIETMWAIKAFEHAEVYFNLLCSVDTKHLRLTPFDDEIYKMFREEFPDLKVNHLTEDVLKNNNAKEIWRNFCAKFQWFEDFSYGTLLRLDCSDDYSEENSILVTRIQFLAIELARNREGNNTCIRSKFKPHQHKPEK
ncbi:protein PBDC1 [Neocloeon triangulifer]|uniref:protein PBDC1 n=1 Tax=Neocloeon triangulifer TaxID=2078957 RepID=UPI00286EF523|nr:protein PBDC1 [Neocloeon triangulifer]